MIIASWLIEAAPAAAAQPQESRLDFEVHEGRNTNRFVRQGNVAAHLVLRAGTDPRILIAFPAGNSGVGLWFAHQAADAEWTLRGAPVAVHASDSRGRPLNGMAVDATVAAPELEIREAVLSSVRVLRDYQA